MNVNLDEEPDDEASLLENIKDPYLKKRSKMASTMKFREIPICKTGDIKNGQMI